MFSLNSKFFPVVATTWTWWSGLFFLMTRLNCVGWNNHHYIFGHIGWKAIRSNTEWSWSESVVMLHYTREQRQYGVPSHDRDLRQRCLLITGMLGLARPAHPVLLCASSLLATIFWTYTANSPKTTHKHDVHVRSQKVVF